LVSSTLLILACGGDDAPTPTPTQTQTATVAPGGGDGGTSGGETPTPTDTTTGGASFSGAETLFISATEFDTVTVELSAGDVLQVTFDVESNIVGGQNVIIEKGKATEGIQLVISDPFDSPILSIDEVTDSGTVEVQAEVTGDHKIVFINPFPLQAQTVELSYIVNP
ncbi:MAG: emp24/gp25L/p24 family protein, partial [Dehalococcoidia bacterium]